MTFGTAVLLLILVLAGMIAAHIFLREKRGLRSICMVLLALTALVLVGYLALTLLFVDAVQNQPPVL